ncbi:MAG: ribosomal L7Ae/L30e/S12e/Gadd45 family protein [Lachnospiraceae bacterium]|nr:ribosomal L7Ae/L30e/S12e/Gadd45 family protein [Lachnospiraceae bacterium]
MEISEKELARLTAQKKMYSLLGLAQKAGALASGEFMTEKAVKEGRARLVLVAEDASENTKKMFRNMCEYYRVDFRCFSDKETLGHRIGKEFRASLAVKDEGFAEAVKKQLDALDGNSGAKTEKSL